MILLPAIDLRDGRCVRLVQGDYDQQTVYDDDPVAVARGFAEAGAQWLHIVDLDAALDGVPKNREVIARVIAAIDLPVQRSGGIRTLDAIDEALTDGAARVVIGTQALLDPAFAAAAIERFGDAVAIGLDVRGERLQARGWTEDAGELFPTLASLDAAGCARYVVTDVAKDGMLQGPNVDLLQRVKAATQRPLVASGGIATLDDLRAVAATGAEACIVGKALYAGAFTLPDALAATAP